MLGNLPQYRALIAVISSVLDAERATVDVEGRAIVDLIAMPGAGPDWRALTPRAVAWLGRRPHPVLDGGVVGAIEQDPRVRRYALLRRLERLAAEWRQADVQVGGPKIYDQIARAVGTLPELAPVVASWPARTPGGASPRDPGAGTGHREW